MIIQNMNFNNSIYSLVQPIPSVPCRPRCVIQCWNASCISSTCQFSRLGTQDPAPMLCCVVCCMFCVYIIMSFWCVMVDVGIPTKSISAKLTYLYPDICVHCAHHKTINSSNHSLNIYVLNGLLMSHSLL